LAGPEGVARTKDEAVGGFLRPAIEGRKLAGGVNEDLDGSEVALETDGVFGDLGRLGG
jgi:hypothetical protein